MAILLIILSACLSILAIYVPGLFFLSWFSFLPLLYLLKKANAKQSFIFGWVFGLVYTALGSYWLFYPLKDFSGLPISFSIIILFLLFGLIGIIYGLWSYFLKSIGVGAVRTAISWAALEYIRYKILSIFPIGYLGYTQAGFKPLLQLADLGGVFLISFIVILINGYLFKLINTKEKKYLVPLLIIFLVIGGYGFNKIDYYKNIAPLENFEIGIVQTNIEQSKKWSADRIDDNMDTIFSNFGKLKGDIELIITPETALTFDLIRNEYYREKLLDMIKKEDSHFQLGAQSIIKESSETYNSTFLFSPDGKILKRYNKNRLIPFGETIPFNSLVNYLTGKSWSSLNPGEKAPLFSIDEISWKNLICSEILYPLTEVEQTEFGFIVNQSNEAWFASGLQKQMWSAAVFRAVENRKTVVRSGNFSKSGVIFPAGNYKIEGVDSKEPIQSKIVINKNHTFYGRHGNYIGYISVIVFLFLIISNLVKGRP